MIDRRCRFALLAMLLAAAPLAAAEEETTAEETGAPASVAGVIESVGPALPGPVVALYVPPTRSTRPMAATANDVHFLNAKTPTWDRLYSAAPKDQPIRSISGYAKSSKALYVAHSTGVASTRDAGASWVEAHPSGYSATTLFALTVHPTDRKQAIVAVQGAAWHTTDAGANWTGYELPGAAEKGVALSFTTLRDKPALVYCSDKAVYYSEADLKSWTTLSRQPSGPVLAQTQGPLTVVLTSGGILEGYELSRPGYRLAKPLGNATATGLALDSSAFGGVFLARAESVDFVSLGSDANAVALDGTSANSANLQAHPRAANGIYWTSGNQVLRLVEGARDFPAGAIAVDKFQRPAEAATSAAAEAPTAGSEDAELEASLILDEIMSRQPPVEEVVALALSYANYRPKEAEQWKRDVRRKNLIPTLAVRGGARERSLDRYDQVTNVDRFGAETREDLYADDDTTYMGEYGVELRWSLSGLLFDKEQLMVSEETRKRNEQRNALITQVTDLYFRRLELLVQHRMNKPATTEQAVQDKLRLRQMTAMLNEIIGQPLFE